MKVGGVECALSFYLCVYLRKQRAKNQPNFDVDILRRNFRDILSLIQKSFQTKKKITMLMSKDRWPFDDLTHLVSLECYLCLFSLIH